MLSSIREVLSMKKGQNKKIAQKFTEASLTFTPPADIKWSITRDQVLVLSKDSLESKIDLKNSYVEIKTHDDRIVLDPVSYSKEHWAILNTVKSRMNNAFSDIQTPRERLLTYEYNSFLVIVDISDEFVLVKNYLGSKKPIKIARVPGVNITVKNSVDLLLSGVSRESVGTMISRLTNLRRLSNFAVKLDKRKFFDNYYLNKI